MKKSRISRKIFVGIIALVLMTLMTISISAEQTSGFYNSPTATAGQRKSCPDVVKLIPTLEGDIYGGDAGIWFFYTNVGLQASFYRDDTRVCRMECWESDNDKADWVRTHTCTFGMSNGYYRPAYNHKDLEVSDQKIESDGTLELYMVFKVNTHPNDTSRNVPKGLISYCFWAH